MKIIDFHSHILPGIDDGSKDIAMTKEMLTSAAQQGIDVMVATPHFYADRMSIQRFLRRREEAFAEAQAVSAECGVVVRCGCETAFFPGMSHADELTELCIDGTRLLMVEMPFRSWNKSDLREIEGLLNRGITPIIAHLERFYGFSQNKGRIEELLELPVYVQLNAECLLRWSMRRLPLRLFREGEAQLLGSDCHNMSSRTPNLAEGRAVLEKKLGAEVLHKMDELGNQLLFG